MLQCSLKYDYTGMGLDWGLTGMREMDNHNVKREGGGSERLEESQGNDEGEKKSSFPSGISTPLQSATEGKMYKGSFFTLKKCQVAAILGSPLITFLL